MPCAKATNGAWNARDAKRGDRCLVITEDKGFMCFAFHQGGDQIALVAHILDIGVKEAAEFLAEGTSTVPQGARGNETKKFEPLDYLQSEH